MYEQPEDSDNSSKFEPLPVIDTSSKELRYRKAGGWLLFLSISLSILSPLVTAVALVVTYNNLQPSFEDIPGLSTMVIVDAVMATALMGLSIHTGIGLWTVRPGAVRAGKRYLLIYLAYLILGPFTMFLADLPPESQQSVIEDSLKQFTRGLIYVTIWYSYLGMSKRVKETFDDA